MSGCDVVTRVSVRHGGDTASQERECCFAIDTPEHVKAIGESPVCKHLRGHLFVRITGPASNQHTGEEVAEAAISTMMTPTQARIIAVALNDAANMAEKTRDSK
jgi:hypothetical protein